MHLNKVMIIGFAGKDAKTSSTPGGKVMTRLSVATTKRYKDAKDEWKSSTQWHEVVVHGKAADYAARITKGAHVLIEGELTYREYERTIETESGPIVVKWPITEVHADSIRLLDRNSNQEERGAA